MFFRDIEKFTLTPVLVYAALVKPEDCTPLKVPTGREDGANGDWIPGLLTGGGFKEAVTEFGPNAARNAFRLEF